MNDAIESLTGRNRDITAAAFVTDDGVVESSSLPAGVDAFRFGAVCASILDACGHASAEIGLGTPTELAIAGASGFVAIASLGNRHLVCTASPSADIGRVLATMRVAFLGEAPDAAEPDAASGQD